MEKEDKMTCELKPEVPAQGILKKNDFGDSMWYTVICECGENEHNHELYIEADEIDVTVHIYTNASSDWWTKNFDYDHDSSFYPLRYFADELVRRAKLIWDILTKGSVKYESHVILNRQQALNYSEVLRQSISDIEHFRDSRGQS